MSNTPNLFNVVSSELFSVLASPNKSLYAEALDVLFVASEVTGWYVSKEYYFQMLITCLEDKLSDAVFSDDDDIRADEKQDVSGRARFIIRLFVNKGWVKEERVRNGSSFDARLVIPGYSRDLLSTLHKICLDEPPRGYLQVVSTWLLLDNAHNRHDPKTSLLALDAAYEQSNKLMSTLSQVCGNIYHYVDKQASMRDPKEILALHFDDFVEEIMSKYVRPLKVKDSITAYRGPVVSILDSWWSDGDLIHEMAKIAAADTGQFVDECKLEIDDKISHIRKIFNEDAALQMEVMDKQVRDYVTDTTRRLESLTGYNGTIRTDLDYLLTKISQAGRNVQGLLDELDDTICLWQPALLTEGGLYSPRMSAKRAMLNPPMLIQKKPDADADDAVDSMMKERYRRRAARNKRMNALFGDSDVVKSSEVDVTNDEVYGDMIMAVRDGFYGDTFHDVSFVGDSHTSGIYTLPGFELRRRNSIHGLVSDEQSDGEGD